MTRDEPLVNEHTLFICNNCGLKEAKNKDSPNKGLDLYQAVLQNPPAGIRVQQVKCLGACAYPAALAVSAPHKCTYVFGDMDTNAHLDQTVTDIHAYCAAYIDTTDGVVAKDKRPAAFTQVLARIPPFDWISETGMVKQPKNAGDPAPGAGIFTRTGHD